MPRREIHLLRKVMPPQTPPGPTSMVLLRLGEQCDQDCVMCPNAKSSERRTLSTEEVLRRIAHVSSLGFRRVALTGGEPTLHPGFGTLVEALGEKGIAWDIATNGGSMARKAILAHHAGLRRAVVSLHSHDPAVDAAITRAPVGTLGERTGCIRMLLESGVAVVVNHVLLPHNLQDSGAFIDYCARELGTRVVVKVAFPLFDLHDRDWAPVRLTYARVRGAIAAMRRAADERGVALLFESIPNCIHGDPKAQNHGRLGFGETHYLDDEGGDRIFSMAEIETMCAAFAEPCARCAAFDRCPGVHVRYAERYGMPEMVPLIDPERSWWEMSTATEIEADS